MTKIIIIGLVGAFVSAVLKKFNSEISFAAAVLTGVAIICTLYLDIDVLVKLIKGFGNGYGVSNDYVKLLLKVVGISYATQFASEIAEECGEKFIARKIDFAGRIFIASLSLPILVNLLNMIVGMI